MVVVTSAGECRGCGGALPERGRGRPRVYCLTCRPAAARPVVPAAPAGVASALAAAGGVEPAPTVWESTRAELAKAGRHHSPLGLAVLTLAARIDEQTDKGSSMAALVRQFQLSLADALKGAEVEGGRSRLDELRS